MHQDDGNSKSLGRGLSSLLGQTKDNSANSVHSRTEAPYFPKTKRGVNNQILNVPIESVKTNPHQPRTNFKESALNDLVNSIKIHGILQPLVVTQTIAGEYELIAGERRLRASKLAGLTEVPVIVRTAKELEKLELSLIENIQRQDLNHIEKAISYKKLVDNFALTHEDAASRLGISRAQFSNMLRLLTLPADVQRGLAEGRITLGQAKVILEIKDDEKREQLYKKAMQTGQTVEDTKREVQKVKINPKTKQIKKDPTLIEWENLMQEKLNTKVSIKKRGDWGGIIEIEFYSEEELSALVKELS